MCYDLVSGLLSAPSVNFGRAKFWFRRHEVLCFGRLITNLYEEYIKKNYVSSFLLFFLYLFLFRYSKRCIK